MRRRLVLLLFCLAWLNAGFPGARAADTAAKNLVAEGNIEYRQMRYAEALAKYEKAIGADAGYVVAQNNRGLTLHKLGRLPEAIAALAKAVQLDAKNASPHLNLGKVLAVAGRHDEALAEFETALRIDPKLAAAVFDKAWTMEEKGDLAGAAATAAKLEGMAGRPLGAALLRGIITARGGRYEELAAACLKPEDLPPQWRWLADLNLSLAGGGDSSLSPEARVIFRKALAVLAREQYAEARSLLAQAAERAGGSPLPFWLLAQAWLAEGNNGETARAMLRAEPLLPRIVIPAGVDPCEVFVDGRRAGNAPLDLAALPGAHHLRLVKCAGGGFQSYGTVVLLGQGTATPAVPPASFLACPRPPGMVPIPGASYQMGSDEGGEQEAPAHPVSVPGFWLDRTEVTNAQYALFLAAVKAAKNGDASWRHPAQPEKKDHTPAYWENKTYNGPKLPVVGVDWFDAYAYARWAGKRLPTEAEWEAAARGSGSRLYPWGGESPDAQGRFRANYDPGIPELDGYARLAPADSFPEGAAACGALNLAGNAWEWTADWYDQDYYRRSPVPAPRGPDKGTERVIRGGGWNSPGGNLRASARASRDPLAREANIGFRCAMDVGL